MILILNFNLWQNLWKQGENRFYRLFCWSRSIYLFVFQILIFMYIFIILYSASLLQVHHNSDMKINAWFCSQIPHLRIKQEVNKALSANHRQRYADLNDMFFQSFLYFSSLSQPACKIFLLSFKLPKYECSISEPTIGSMPEQCYIQQMFFP